MAGKSPQEAVDEYLEIWLGLQIMESIEYARSKIVLRKLGDLLEDGNKKAAQVLLMNAAEELFEKIGGLLESVGHAAAEAEVEDIKNWKAETLQKAELNIVFNRADPYFVRAINKQSVNMAKDLTASQRQAVKAALNEGVGALKNVNMGGKIVSGNFATNPVDMARDFRDSIGLTEKQMKAVQNFRRALETNSPHSLNYALRDKRHDKAVERALKTKVPLDKAHRDRIVENYRKSFVSFRARTIARTEALSAANIARHSTWSQAVKKGVIPEKEIKRFWVSTKDTRTRDTHRALPNLNKDGVGIKEPFQTSRWWHNTVSWTSSGSAWRTC